jgi:hypothetical protein
MQTDRQHHMNMTQIFSTGAEEWSCPRCGRRFILQIAPAYQKIVLEEGDTSVPHSGAKSGMHMEASESDRVEAETAPENEERLDAWKQFLKDIDFDSLWEEDDRSNTG